MLALSLLLAVAPGAVAQELDAGEASGNDAQPALDAGVPAGLGAETTPEPTQSDGGELSPVHNIEELDLESLLSQPVVTASGMRQSKAVAGANVLVITKEEIANHG